MKRRCYSLWLFHLHSAVKIQPFSPVFPLAGAAIRHFVGYPFGASRKKASTVFYNTAYEKPPCTERRPHASEKGRRAAAFPASQRRGFIRAAFPRPEPWERKGALSGKGLPFQPVYPAVRRKLFTARRARNLGEGEHLMGERCRGEAPLDVAAAAEP